MLDKLMLSDGKSIDLPGGKKQATRYLADIFQNDGRIPQSEDKIDWQDFLPVLTDAVSTSEIRPLLQSTMEVLIREPVEPMMVITGLYTKVNTKGMNTQVLSGAMGAVHAGDVNEHGTYPEVMFQVGSGLQTAYIGKSGIAASFTDEALRYSTWDIMAINLRLMGQALVRHKEGKAVAFLKELGTTLFDNATPAASTFGVLTGRGLDMAANGSLTMDDLFKGMAFMAEQGFPADVLLMNPLFFYLFIQDPVMRGIMMAGGGGDYFSKFTGNPGPLDPWSNGSMGAAGPTLGNAITPVGTSGATGISGREHGMTAAPPIPTSYFPWNMRVIVSPLVPFDPESGLGDIILLSSGNVGYYLVDEDPVTVEWRDEDVEVIKMKIRERYGFAVAHEGLGVGVFKNVPLHRNFWDGVVRAHTLDVSAEIAALTDLSAVL